MLSGDCAVRIELGRLGEGYWIFKLLVNFMMLVIESYYVVVRIFGGLMESMLNGELVKCF